ncbi:unnamed protein product [Ectocarpus sp. CCAP 1310/34]|nr:unnamed protein product [Ectocarpus sp. CCAP 1310/34]
MQHDAFHRKRAVPRPAVHKACVGGFNAGLAATTALVTKRIESMDDDARNSFMDNNANLLLEADAERDTSEEVATARDAQQVQQERNKAADPKETKEDTGVDSSAATTAGSGTAAAHSRLQRIVPGETRKDAPISGVQDFSGTGAGGAHYPELPWAGRRGSDSCEMLEEALTRGTRTQGLQSALEDYHTNEVNALPALVVEKEAYAGFKDERTIEDRNDPAHRGMAESVKGLKVPLKKERASSEAVGGQAGLEPDLERDAATEDDAAIALSNDRRQQSIRMTESVKGLEFPLAQESAPSEALNGQAGSEADLEREAASEDSAGVELSNSGWHQKEAAATGAVLVKRGALHDGLKYTGGAFQKSREYPEALSAENVEDSELSLVEQKEPPRERLGEGEAAAETGFDGGSENSTVTNLANDRVFLEAFMEEHVQGSETPLVQQDGPTSNFDDPDDESATAYGQSLVQRIP